MADNAYTLYNNNKNISSLELNVKLLEPNKNDVDATRQLDLPTAKILSITLIN